MFETKYFSVEFTRNWDKGFALGASLYTHYHMKDFPYHTHLLINLGLWFLEFSFGKGYPDEENNV